MSHDTDGRESTHLDGDTDAKGGEHEEEDHVE